MASATAVAHEGKAHPTLEFYVKIAITLAIITAVEVAIYYIPALRPVLVPALLILSLIKFVSVVAYFMHLKFDGGFLVFVFTAAMIVSVIVLIALAVVMHFGKVEFFVPNMSIFTDQPGLTPGRP